MTRVRDLSREDRFAWTELWAGYLRFYRAESRGGGHRANLRPDDRAT